MIVRVLLVSVGGFFGAASRYLVSEFVESLTKGPFPYGTLTVNATGSFLLALLLTGLFESGTLPAEYRFLILTGFLGSFTTFSTFSYQSLELFRNGLTTAFLLNLLANLELCLLGAWVGLLLGGGLHSA